MFRFSGRFGVAAAPLIALLLIAGGCSSSSDDADSPWPAHDPAQPGTGGSAGKAGSAGAGNSGGPSNQGGAANTGGSNHGGGNSGGSANTDGGNSGGSAGAAGGNNPSTPYKPFPQQVSFPNTIKPANLSQGELDQKVASYFDTWKSTYVKASNGTTPGGGFYVAMKGTGGDGNEKTTSEAHGYGMIVFALMAGYDPGAQSTFDGFFNMYDHHRSKIDDDLMSWVIDETESTGKDSDSATDGDMDIAYSLLLAHSQWGSTGTVNYLAEAKRIIQDGIKSSEVGAASHRVMLGDWSDDQNATRPSDWMTGHFVAYQNATGDAFWGNLRQKVYDLTSQVGSQYSPGTGLMPDFVVDSTPKPAAPNFLEAGTDGDYSWNACRFPLRMAVDYAHNGSPEAKAALDKILGWLKPKTGNDPSKIKAGYTLGGEALVSYSSGAFTAPIVAASVSDPAHQDYLDVGFALIASGHEAYYED